MKRTASLVCRLNHFHLPSICLLVIPFSVIVSFIDSIIPGRIYAWRSTIGCKGATTEENAENLLTMEINLKAMTSVKERSRSKQCLQKTTVLLAGLFMSFVSYLGGKKKKKKEKNARAFTTIDREFIWTEGSFTKGLEDILWQLQYWWRQIRTARIIKMQEVMMNRAWNRYVT